MTVPSSLGYGFFPALFAEQALSAFKDTECPIDMLQKKAPITRQHDPASLAIEKWDSEFLLQLGNSAADRRLRNE